MIKFVCLFAKCLRFSTLFLLCATVSIKWSGVGAGGSQLVFLRVNCTVRCLMNSALAF